MDKRKQDKLSNAVGKNTTPVTCNLPGDSSVILISGALASCASAPLLDTNKNAHIANIQNSSCAAVIKCFYGHKVSSASDWQGREQWRFSPTPPWPGVPPARPLCQKCYLFHRSEYLKGNSQYHFLQLYVNRPPDVGGASSSCSARPPGH